MAEESRKGKRGKSEGVEEKRKDKGKEKEWEMGQKQKQDEEEADGEMKEETPVEWCKWVANRLSQILVKQSQLEKELVEVRREAMELWLFDFFIIWRSPTRSWTQKEGEESEIEEEEGEEEPAREDVVVEDGEIEKGGAEKEGDSEEQRKGKRWRTLGQWRRGWRRKRMEMEMWTWRQWSVRKFRHL
jgi:hypothetical protein